MVREISTYAELCASGPDWADLWARAQDATPFNSPEWLLPWWRHLFQGGTMWTITVYDHDRLTGVAPMFVYGLPGEPRRVSFIGSGVTDYLGFLVEDEDAARQIWHCIAEARDRWDICDLQEIRAGSSTLLSAPRNVERCVSSICPVLRLPSTMQELESRLSSKFRHNLRNSRNRLDGLGASFETAGPARDGEYVEALFRLHAARWNSKGETGVLDSGPLQSFFRDAVAGFRRRGWLRFHGLRFCGELEAIVCIFCALERSAYYLCGFGARLSRYSPGSAVLRFAIEQAIEENCSGFDFLRDGEKYKYDWGAADEINFRVVLTKANSETSASFR